MLVVIENWTIILFYLIAVLSVTNVTSGVTYITQLNMSHFFINCDIPLPHVGKVQFIFLLTAVFAKVWCLWIQTEYLPELEVQTWR